MPGNEFGVRKRGHWGKLRGALAAGGLQDGELGGGLRRRQPVNQPRHLPLLVFKVLSPSGTRVAVKSCGLS